MALSKQFDRVYSLLDLCDATQQNRSNSSSSFFNWPRRFFGAIVSAPSLARPPKVPIHIILVHISDRFLPEPINDSII
jgi:hypothetical protein